MVWCRGVATCVVAVGIIEVSSQQVLHGGVQPVALQLEQLLSASYDPERLLWLENFLRELEGSRDKREGLHDEIRGEEEYNLSDSQQVSDGEYDDDESSDSSDDSSDDLNQYADRKHHWKKEKKHKSKHKSKCDKTTSNTDEGIESNVFSRIRGVNIGSTFANIQIIGGNVTSPEAPRALATPSVDSHDNLPPLHIVGNAQVLGSSSIPVDQGQSGSTAIPDRADTTPVVGSFSTTAMTVPHNAMLGPPARPSRPANEPHPQPTDTAKFAPADEPNGLGTLKPPVTAATGVPVMRPRPASAHDRSPHLQR